MAGLTMTFGSGVMDSVFGKSQEPIRMFLERRGEQFEQQSILPELFCMEKTDKWSDKLTSMTAMEGFKAVGENGAYPKDEMREGYSKVIEQMTWKDEFSISQEAVEDSVMMDFKQRPEAFITGYYRTRERFGVALYGGAMAGQQAVQMNGHSFSLLCADGQPLFSANHEEKVTGKRQSNIFSNAFSDDSLGMLETHMQNFEGDNGEVLDVAPTTIIIPNFHDLKKSVFAAIGADKDPNTGNNGANYTFGRWNVIISSYLNEWAAKLGSTARPWILMDGNYNKTYRGSVWLDRLALTVRSEIDSNTDANVFKGRARFSAGFNDFRHVAVGGIPGAAALS